MTQKEVDGKSTGGIETEAEDDHDEHDHDFFNKFLKKDIKYNENDWIEFDILPIKDRQILKK